MKRSMVSTATPPSRSVLLGAAFLMATSAIGPGFLTQTSKFTSQLGAPLIMVILLVIFMDIVAQMNIWSVVSVSGMRGQDIANKVFPGLGYALAALISFGGLAFNVGNIGGVALGLNAMLGLNEKIGAVIAGCVGIFIFSNKNAKSLMDKTATVLATAILVSVAVIAVISEPPIGDVLQNIVQIEKLGNNNMLLALTTLLGGTCGGYIAFSGAHRLVDAGITGAAQVSYARKSVLQGSCTSGVVRVLLFLAVLGTCTVGGVWSQVHADTINTAVNPAAEVFRIAGGTIGYRLFGVCLFAASLSSVVGAAYTSVSFLKTLHPSIARHEQKIIIGFITVSTLVMVILGGAATLVVVVGAFNGLILPISLAVMLLASRKREIIGKDYRHPVLLTVLGCIVVVVSAVAGIFSFSSITTLFQ